METILTASAMRQADAETIRRLEGNGLILMEHAAMACTREIEQRLQAVGPGPVVILCGKGNNGGDGMAVARQLAARGHAVTVWLVGNPSELSADAATQWAWLGHTPVVRREWTEDARAVCRADLQQAAVVVDAVLGTGLNRPATGMAADAIQLVRKTAPAWVVSVDVPSGLNADAAVPEEPHVRADVTVTFGRRKPCHTLYPASAACGRTVLSPITIPDDVVAGTNPKLFRIERDDVRAMLPAPAPDAHKGTFGHVLIVGGQAGRIGASMLAAQAALRSGSGLVTVHLDERLYPVAGPQVMEVMFSLSEFPYRKDVLAAATEGKQAAVVGPGFGTDASAGDRLRAVLEAVTCPLVLDADVFRLTRPATLRALVGDRPAVLTPHPGELAAFMEIQTADIAADRVSAVRQAASDTGMVSILKGHQTLIALPDGRVFINPTGNPGMGTAGSGDVLAGIIGSFLGQGLAPADAVMAGVYIHGLAGDRKVRKKTYRGLTATDLIRGIPKALRHLQEDA